MDNGESRACTFFILSGEQLHQLQDSVPVEHSCLLFSNQDAAWPDLSDVQLIAPDPSGDHVLRVSFHLAPEGCAVPQVCVSVDGPEPEVKPDNEAAEDEVTSKPKQQRRTAKDKAKVQIIAPPATTTGTQFRSRMTARPNIADGETAGSQDRKLTDVLGAIMERLEKLESSKASSSSAANVPPRGLTSPLFPSGLRSNNAPSAVDEARRLLSVGTGKATVSRSSAPPVFVPRRGTAAMPIAAKPKSQGINPRQEKALWKMASSPTCSGS